MTDNEMHPLISIIVAVFNGKARLQQCIDSVSQQTYPNNELIIIDGGSKDGTIDLLKANQEKIRYWISEPDQGICDAWNKGLAQAKGDWICFLGADDYFWNGQVLERLARKLGELPPQVHLAYGQIMLVNADGTSLYPLGDPWESVKRRFKQLMCIPHPGALHRRSLFEKHGKFDESFHIAGDYEFLLRELNTEDAYFIPDILTVAMRQGGISSTPSSSLMQLREVRRAQRMHGLLVPGPFWVMANVRVLIRLLLWSVLGERMARKTLDLGRTMMGLPAYWTRT